MTGETPFARYSLGPLRLASRGVRVREALQGNRQQFAAANAPPLAFFTQSPRRTRSWGRAIRIQPAATRRGNWKTGEESQGVRGSTCRSGMAGAFRILICGGRFASMASRSMAPLGLCLTSSHKHASSRVLMPTAAGSSICCSKWPWRLQRRPERIEHPFAERHAECRGRCKYPKLSKGLCFGTRPGSANEVRRLSVRSHNYPMKAN